MDLTRGDFFKLSGVTGTALAGVVGLGASPAIDARSRAGF